MELSDQELCLRPRAANDRVVLDWSGDSESERFGLELEGSSWSGQWDRRRRQAFWICVDGTEVGEVDLFDIRRGDQTAELRIGIAGGSLLGKGYGRRALQLLLTYAELHLRLREVYLRVRENNGRAVACYRSCGFRARGRLEGRHFPDPVLLMTRRLGSERPVERASCETLVEDAVDGGATGLAAQSV